MNRLKRKDRHVQELIEHLDHRLISCNGDVALLKSRLTLDEQESIDVELHRASSPDPASGRYFLENYFVINTKGESAAQELQTMYPFKESQEVLWDDFEFCWKNKLMTWWIMLKARQIGWSTVIQGLLFQRVIFNRLMKILVIADEWNRTNNILGMSILAYNNLPFWMRPEVQYANRGKGIWHFDRKDDEARIVNPGLNSTLYSDAANKPSGSSRGFTLHGAHMSEFGLFRNPRIVTSDIIPALAKGNPLVISVVEGTADEGHNAAYKRMWEEAMKGKGMFRPLFAGWWKEKTYCKPFPLQVEEEEFLFSPEETDLAKKVKDEFGHAITKEQMSWYRQQADQFEATEDDRDRMEQEYPSYPRSAFRSSGKCAFNRKRLTQIEISDVRSPIWFGDLTFKVEGAKETPVFDRWGPTRRPDGSIDRTGQARAPLWIWEWPNSKDLYYGASDPSQGIPGRDNSAAAIWRVPKRLGERIRQCLEYQGYANPATLAKIMVTMGKFYNKCEISPEANIMTEHLQNIIHIHKYPNLYRWRRQDKITNHWTTYFGWETNHKSREDLIARFGALMLDNQLEIKSQRLLDECNLFIDDGSGRFEAAGGTHDDTLFASLICVYCLREFLLGLDPSLLATAEEPPLENTKKDFSNTDYSLEDKEDEMQDTEFSML